MAALAKILKTHKVDKILGYRQLAPDKDRKIIFGWEEKNELPKDAELILSRPIKRQKGEVSIATKDDYILYFSAIIGSNPSEFLSESESLKNEVRMIKIEPEFATNMAKLLVDGNGFTWKNREFLVIEEKIS